MEIKLKVLAALLLLSLTLTGAESLARTEWQQQDIGGGARLIFGRPENPQTHANSKRQTGAQSSQQGGASSATTRLTDKVDDAIALGNAARDREPPDLDSAETAYRLASKLDPRDPRPYVGLGNIYMDEGKYAEAARSYREAIRLGAPRFGNLGKIGSFGIGASSVDNRSAARWHAYLATAWLGQQKASEGERELLDAISIEPGNAQWRALLGYSLFLQHRYTDASGAYAVAIQLDPANESYKKLLQESLQQAESASANDRSITKALEETEWEVRSPGNVIKGTCQLQLNKSLHCTFADKELPYETLQWKVQDGLLEMTRTVQHGLLGVSQSNLSFPSCIGRLESEVILVKCSSTDTDTSEAWTKRNKN